MAKPEALDNTLNAILITIDEDGKRHEWPYRRRPLPTFLADWPPHAAAQTWMKHITFDQLVELWWMAQGLRAAEAEIKERRALDPNDMAGKSAEYVMSYYKQRSNHDG
jgi:hypothetical protein